MGSVLAALFINRLLKDVVLRDKPFPRPVQGKGPPSVTQAIFAVIQNDWRISYTDTQHLSSLCTSCPSSKQSENLFWQRTEIGTVKQRTVGSKTSTTLTMDTNTCREETSMFHDII